MTSGTVPNFSDRYEYTGNKFSGGQGDVFVCKDKLLDRSVAIKVVANVSNIAEFYQEIASIKDVSSCHIAEIYDLISIDNGDYPGLVEEYVPGKILSEFPQGNFSQEDYLRALYQIASGIADMHANNKIHRDIKPNNMKFDDEGIIKILDFGIACDIDPGVDTVAARGTRGFRAPELYFPPIMVTPAVDVYAFGVTAWYLAEGNLPPALLEVPPLHTMAAPSFGALSLSLTEDIVAILDSSLSSNPHHRPVMGSIRDVIKDRLLFGTHRAEFVYGTKKWVLDKVGTHLKLGRTDLGSIAVMYDGIHFVINEFEGDVYINNRIADVGEILPDSCVVTIGSINLGSSRLFIPFNVSHPEVVL